MSELQAAKSAAPTGQLRTDINSVWLLVNYAQQHPHVNPVAMTEATASMVHLDCEGVPE
jgi:hypothetical protein